MKKDVMIDFETLGTGNNACLLQVGACFFDRLTGEIGATFKRNIDPRTSVKNGSQIDADTVMWWMAQSKEAQNSMLDVVTSPEGSALSDLNWFLLGADSIWSHATFDFPILQASFKRLDLKPNFKYNAAKDIRTLMDLAGLKSKEFEHLREGVFHDALDDCKHQVKYCVEAFKRLNLER